MKIKLSKHARVKCDSCKKYLNVKIIKESFIANDPLIKIQYFECAKCGAKFLICIDDFQTNALKQEVRQLQLEINAENYEKIKVLKKEISEHENKLREHYKSELTRENFFDFNIN